MKSNNYNPSLNLVENALAKAEYYEKQGNKEKAAYFFKLAEKAEQVMKKNRETIANITKTKGSE